MEVISAAAYLSDGVARRQTCSPERSEGEAAIVMLQKANYRKILMNKKWNFGLFKVILIFCCGVVLGGNIALLTTNNVSKIGAWCGIISMLLVVTSVLIGSRIKDK